jgi:putative hemolysin
MTDTIFLLSFLFLVVWGLDLAFIAANTSLQEVNRTRLLSRHQEEPRHVDALLALLDAPRRLILMEACLRWADNAASFLCVGIAFIIGALSLRLSTISAIDLLIGLGIWGVIALLLTWTETLTIEIVRRQPEKFAIGLVSLMHIVEIIFRLVAWPPLLILRGSQPATDGNVLVTEDELRTMVDASQKEGILEQGERRMINSIFDLGDTVVREIMVPRIDIIALDIQQPFSEAIDELLASGYSRVPVYEETIDNILGLLYAKDLLKAWRDGSKDDSLRTMLRPAYFIPEAKKVDELLTEMQSRRIHIAIVVDEYGGVAGLVTLEDIVEEIVGEIRDEYDDGEEVFYEEISPNVFLCSGRMDVDDLNELLDGHLPVDEADTLAGLIYSKAGHVPVQGESILVDGIRLTVEQVSKRRIRQVRVEKLLQEVEEDTQMIDEESGK